MCTYNEKLSELLKIYLQKDLVMMQRLMHLARPNWEDDNVTPHESIPMLIKGTKNEEVLLHILYSIILTIASMTLMALVLRWSSYHC